MSMPRIMRFCRIQQPVTLEDMQYLMTVLEESWHNSPCLCELCVARDREALTCNPHCCTCNPDCNQLQMHTRSLDSQDHFWPYDIFVRHGEAVLKFHCEQQEALDNYTVSQYAKAIEMMCIQAHTDLYVLDESPEEARFTEIWMPVDLRDVEASHGL